MHLEINERKCVCEKHGEFVQEFFFSKILGKECTSECPECSKENESKHTADIKQIEKETVFDRMRIEKEFENASFENFIPKTESQKQALEACKNICDKKIGNVILIGSNGTGKTHLAVSCVKELKGIIYTLFEISLMVRNCYTTMAKESELDFLDRISRVPFLVIDEVGRSKSSDAEKNWMSYIIDKRHVRHLPTMMISNNHMKKDCPKKGCELCFENFFNNDVLSRLSQDKEIVSVQAEDHRRSR